MNPMSDELLPKDSDFRSYFGIESGARSRGRKEYSSKKPRHEMRYERIKSIACVRN